MNKKIIIYIIVIIIILAAVFFSQQAVSSAFGKSLISAVYNQASAYLAKGTNLVIPNIYSKISEDVKSGGEAIQTVKNKISQTEKNISDAQKNVENYFSGIKDAVAGKNNNNCTITAPTN